MDDELKNCIIDGFTQSVGVGKAFILVVRAESKLL